MQLWNIFLLIQLVVSTKGEDELVAVSVLVRHGQRAPLSFYPTDPYRNITIPFLNDLTPNGMKDMFDQGKWLRNNYKNFLSKKYLPQDIYVRTIEFDRSLMTSELVLAGLYPPTREEIWNPRIRWQPIPIHSSPKSQDIINNMLHPCPHKLTATIETLKGSPLYLQFMREYGPLLDYLSKKSGEKVTIVNLYSLFDTLFSEKSLGLPLPTWAENIYPKILPAINKYTKLNSITPTERKLQAGPLVTEIFKQFEHAINEHDFGTTKTIYRKFMAYFSTEWLFYDLSYGIGIKNIGIPNYGAAFMVELRKNDKGYYVNILYRDGAALGTETQEINIEGKNFNLKFDTFKKIAEPLLTNTTDWVQLCDNFAHGKASVITGVPMS